MKINIQFDMPEDETQYQKVTKAWDYWSAICDLATVLRQKVKYSDDIDTTWEHVHEEFYKVMADYRIDPFE